MMKVAVFGAGMAGLSAAHELRKASDLEIEVYESSDGIGGKSRNQYGGVLPAGTGGREDLPGEHGFRFFPGFYKNIIKTLEEIPVSADAFVADRLVGSPDAGLAKHDTGLLTFARSIEIGRLTEIASGLLNMYEELEFASEDIARMAWFNIKYLTSCRERRLSYDSTNWWNFIDAESPRYTEAFREFEAAIPRTMSALVAKESSTLVVGDVTMQFLFGAMGDHEKDRLLDGPTDEAWLNPWFDHLKSTNGGTEVKFNFDTKLVDIKLAADGKSVESVKVDNAGIEEVIVADYYLVAIPVEHFVPLISAEMRNADPQLDALKSTYTDEKWTGWMVGAQIGLKVDQPMVAGHAFYPSSTWALTSVSQAQFWENRGKLETRFGDGATTGMLSVIISDWETSSDTFPAANTTANRDQLVQLLGDQLRYELDATAEVNLAQSNINFIHLDDAVDVIAGQWRNKTPLLLHPEDAYDVRPSVSGEIGNLFLASDYIKTNVKLATMEGACEAARKAVGAIFEEVDALAMEPAYWHMEEPETIEPFKMLDEAMVEHGKDHVMDQFPLNLLIHAPGLIPFVPPLLEFIDQISANTAEN
jgi:15-cis-phytoene desaturase